MSTIDKFKERMYAEYSENGGRKPDVAILGSETYDELSGELKLYFGSLLVPVKKEVLEMSLSEFRYEGVHIFKSYWMKRGMMFAAAGEEP